MGRFIVCWICYATSALAHEFWIEPIDFRVEVGKRLQAHIKVGEEFKGNRHAFIPNFFRTFDIHFASQKRAVSSRVGDVPAVNELASRDGLYIVSYESKATKLVYPTLEKFASFVRKHDMGWVLKAHAARKLSSEKIIEAYWRDAKSLVGVGSASGSDRRLGLAFEWVVETNPYSKGDINQVKARLFWQGKPSPNTQAVVFRTVLGKTSRFVYKTDRSGRARIPVGRGGRFLLNAVRMVEARPKTSAQIGAVWESFWASTTYEVRTTK